MKIAICDSDVSQIKNCKKMLDILGKKYDVSLDISAFSTNERLIFDMESDPNKVDLIYMEINFQEEQDGIQAAKKLREFGYINEIIFYSSAKDRILDVFDVEAMYFLLKGETSASKFEEVFLAAKTKAEKKGREVIVLSCANESRSIPLDDILYFEFNKRLIMVHYRDEEFEFYSTLGKLEKLLAPKGFVRAHKAFLVSTRVIDSISGSDIILKDGTVLPLSRTYSKNVKSRFNELSRSAY